MFFKLTPRNRRRLSGLVIFFLTVMVWWNYGMAPLKLQQELVGEELAMLNMEKERLLLRQTNLSSMDLDGTALNQELVGLGRLMIGGRRVEEVNAATHLQIQEILERHGLSLKSYRELGVTPWRSHQLGRIQVQLDTNMQGLANLLLSLDELEKTVRVDNLTVRYRRTRGDDLQILLEFSTLFIRHAGLQ